MSDVDDELIKAAVSELAVEQVGPMGAPGGQKAVRHVRRDGTDLVLKVIQVASSSPEMLTRAEREVELLSRLDSPHVVKVVSEFVELGSPVRGAAWLEEYLDGSDLTPLLGTPWSWAETKDLGLQIGKGLAAGHAAGVVHRDLSPNNIRRLSTGQYKVLDFGVAHHTLRTGITVAGQPGTPGFMSPEHLNGYSGRPIPASDIFCAGILLYAALTGVNPTPYLGDDAEYIHRLSRGQVIPITQFRQDLSPQQLGFMLRCLHPQPARRFRNGEAFYKALEGVQ